MSSPQMPSFNTDEMFVQTARAALSDHERITLTGLSASTLYFADRPRQPIVGHMSTEDFVEMWDHGANSFADNPPLAIISFLHPDDDTPADAALSLRQPHLELAGHAITYTVEAFDSELPVVAGAVTLFIDPLARPYSPAWVAAMRCRARRVQVPGRAPSRSLTTARTVAGGAE